MPDNNPNLTTNETIEHQKIIVIMDEASMTAKHYWLWLIASGGTLIDGVSIMLIGIALHLRSSTLTPLMMGLIGAALVIGAVFGSNLGGKLCDILGRKKLLIANMALITIGALLSAFSFSPWLLLIAQLIIGAGIGSDFAASGTYVAEIMPKKQRSRLMVGTITFQSVGLLIAGLMALAVLVLADPNKTTQYLFTIEVLIALLFFCFRLTLIESPRWLMAQGKNLEGTRLIAQLIPEKQKILQQFGNDAGSEMHCVIKPMQGRVQSNYGLLFSKEYIKRTILVSVPWFLMDIATYGVGLFTPVILASVIHASASESLHKREIHIIIGTTSIDSFLLIGFLLALWLVPRLGKIKMQSIGFAGMFVGMVLLFLDTYLNIAGTWHTVLIFGGFVIFNLFMNMGPNATTFTLAPELFPTQLRSTAGGFAAGFAKIGATLGVFVFPLIKNKIGIDVILLSVSLISLLALFITTIYSEKIQEAKSLEFHHR